MVDSIAGSRLYLLMWPVLRCGRHVDIFKIRRGNNVQRDSGVSEMVCIRFVLTSAILLASVAFATVNPIFAQTTDRLTSFERAPLLKEPTTPEEMFAATLLMVDLIRFDLAEKYLEQFEAASPDDETLIKLRDKHGTGDFLKLARTKELQPRSTRLLERLNLVAKTQAEDPAFVDGLVRRLIKGGDERDLAIKELRNAGVRVVPQMLKQMSSPEMHEHQDSIVIALTRMGNQVVPPLIGVLDSPNEPIRAAIIDVLGWLNAEEAIPYLWFPAFDKNQPEGVRVAAKRNLTKLWKGSAERVNQLSSLDASNELKRLAKLHYRKSNALPVDEQGRVAIWNWNDAEETVAEQLLTPEIASLVVASRFAHQALVLSPDQTEPQRQYLAAILGLEVLRNGWDKPRIANPGSAMYLAMIAGEATVSQVLAEALEASQPATAVAALEVLSQIGSREQLFSQKGLKSPVVAALNSPDHRVQFAAATTVLKLDPKNAFNGAGRVVDILSRAITDPGQPRAIVIDADTSRATVASGYLAEGGYEGIVTVTGREGFDRAATSAGIELIVVHVNCMRWELKQTLANLRADARTAALPIVVYGPSSLERELSRLVARSAPATYVVESASSSDFLEQLLPFLKTLKTPPMSAQERDLQKNTAVYWLSSIGGSGLSRVFEISHAEKELSVAIEDPAVAINALTALGSISTRSAQQRIANIALNSQMSEPIRETAANQLAFHIQRHGVLLTQDEVRDLQTGWKNTDNPRVKSALASVIGSLRPSAAVVGERLRVFPIPSAN